MNSLSFPSSCATLLFVCTACGPSLDPVDADDTTTSSATTTGDASATGSTPGSTASTPEPSPTSTTGAVDSSGGDVTTEGMAFIEPTGSCLGGADDPWHCTWDCSVLASRECADGEKCNVWANNEDNEWNATRCSPMPEQTFPPGAPCTMEYSQTSGFDDCAHGSTCWDTDPNSLMGTCRAFCDPEDSEACGAEDQHCAILHEEVFALCLTSCNPLEPSACGPGEGCRFVLSAGGPYCVPLDGGVVTDSGMSCGEGSCDVDSMCLPADWVPGCRDEECCTPWCDRNDQTDSVCTAVDPSMYCVPLYPGGAPPKGPLVGLEAVGFCAIQPE